MEINTRRKAHHYLTEPALFMAKKPLISEEERALFQAAVNNVTPLAATNQAPPPPAKPIPASTHHQSKLPDHPLDLPPLERAAQVTPVGAETIVTFAQSGVQPRVLQRLRRGEFRPDAAVDLHGLSVRQAEHLLQRFLPHALEQNWRCVQIIHGKGTRSGHEAPLLKNQVNSWLRAYPGVLAFCSAKPSAGGTGAVYVLLKQL